jgi:ubiquinone/menaquinone biosynthesis C-methylase UbiE
MTASPRNPRSYDVGRFNLEHETQRLRIQAQLTWLKEARNLAWYGLRDGMSVLELGSGPGFVTEQLLGLLPSSAITAVEIAPEMIERAQRYLGGRDEGRLRFVQGNVLTLPLPENAFDFAIARFLYQHLLDPIAAARETLRLLKPGGKFVLVDVDDHLWGIADPPRPTEAALVERGIAAQAAQGGDRLVGRKFLRILRAAGFQDPELDLVVYSSDLAGDRFREVLRELMDDDLQIEVKDGVMTQDEADDVRASDERWLAGEHPLMLEIVMMACGVKP